MNLVEVQDLVQEHFPESTLTPNGAGGLIVSLTGNARNTVVFNQRAHDTWSIDASSCADAPSDMPSGIRFNTPSGLQHWLVGLRELITS